jgi:hypothetical protein
MLERRFTTAFTDSVKASPRSFELDEGAWIESNRCDNNIFITVCLRSRAQKIIAEIGDNNNLEERRIIDGKGGSSGEREIAL